MPKIEIYTTRTCPYCHKAKRLLNAKKAEFAEIDVTMNQSLRAQMKVRAKGSNTVPQIFINDQHIGGCDDLYELDEDGGLDPLLQQP
jgi:glutaredoxin 3